MADDDTFDAPEGFDPSRWKEYREIARESALHLIEQIASDGFTERQAGSITAHVMLEVAWVAAACGALSEGQQASPERFLASAQAAMDRVTLPTPDQMGADHG
jgi:hypothetical protein